MTTAWRYLRKDMNTHPRRWEDCRPEDIAAEVGRYYCVTDPALEAVMQEYIVITPRYHFRAEQLNTGLGRAVCSLCQAPRPIAELGEPCRECYRGEVVKAGAPIAPRPALLIAPKPTKAPTGTAYCLHCGEWYTLADIDKECTSCRGPGIITRAGWCSCDHPKPPRDRWGRCKCCGRVQMDTRSRIGQ